MSFKGITKIKSAKGFLNPSISLNDIKSEKIHKARNIIASRLGVSKSRSTFTIFPKVSSIINNEELLF